MQEIESVPLTTVDVLDNPRMQWIRNVGKESQGVFEQNMSLALTPVPDTPLSLPPPPEPRLDHGADITRTMPTTIFETLPKKRGKHPPLPKEALNYSNRIGGKLVGRADRIDVVGTIGGLGSALMSYARGRNGAGNGDSHRDPHVYWTGWDGLEDNPKTSPFYIPDSGEIFRKRTRTWPVKMNAISLEPEDVTAHYNNMSNALWWFFLQEQIAYLQDSSFNMSDYERHRNVNLRMAQEADDELKRRNGPVLFHDYHLMFAGAELRKLRPEQMIGWFDHITWPDPTVLDTIPEGLRNNMEWVMPQVIDALLQNNVVGFQTNKDRTHFQEWIKKYRPDVNLLITPNGTLAQADDIGKTIIDSFPISVDPHELQDIVKKTEPDEELTALLERHKGKIKIVCVGRLDPTKGFLQGVNAIDALLERHPEFRGRIVAIEVASTSREKVDAYKQLKGQFEQRVDEINKRWEEYGPVIEYVKGLPHDQTLKLLSLANVAYVHTEVDGMNLVAKEAVAVGKSDMSLIIGKNAGAVEELGDNSYVVDVNNVDDMIYCLFGALNVTRYQHLNKKLRMERIVREFNVHKWGNRLFSTLNNFEHFVRLIQESAFPQAA